MKRIGLLFILNILIAGCIKQEVHSFDKVVDENTELHTKEDKYKMMTVEVALHEYEQLDPNFEQNAENSDEKSIELEWEPGDRLLFLWEDDGEKESIFTCKEVYRETGVGVFEGVLPVERQSFSCYYLANQMKKRGLRVWIDYESTFVQNRHNPTEHIKEYLLLGNEEVTTEELRNGIELKIKNCLMCIDLSSKEFDGIVKDRADDALGITWTMGDNSLHLKSSLSDLLELTKYYFVFEPEDMSITNNIMRISFQRGNHRHAITANNKTMQYQPGGMYKIAINILKAEEKEEEEPNNPPQLLQNIFSCGVSLDKGWVDINKLKDNAEDHMSCWLITASNMIQWWQNVYIQSGHTLPLETPNGEGNGAHKNNIFDYARQCFTRMDRGGNINTALSWYIEGKAEPSDNHSQPIANTGGYLKSVDASKREYSQKCFSVYDDWAKAKTEKLTLNIFSKKIIERLEKGCVIGLDIKSGTKYGGALHAITLWGAEINKKSKEVVSIYITDSDDYVTKLMKCTIHSDLDYWQDRIITMQIPQCDAYPEGADWEIVTMYYLKCPK